MSPPFREQNGQFFFRFTRSILKSCVLVGRATHVYSKFQILANVAPAFTCVRYNEEAIFELYNVRAVYNKRNLPRSFLAFFQLQPSKFKIFVKKILFFGPLAKVCKKLARHR